ncbi:MAG: TonB family protein [Candidatus Omnitrophica bacterium]|nr:TonB family protein [Candidatus Omnitrophota bacterium]
MYSEKVFQITLLVSAITHGVILFQNGVLNLAPNQKKENKIELSYIIKEPEKKLEPIKAATPAPKREPFLKLAPNVTAEKRTPPPFVDNQDFFKKLAGNIPPKPAVIKPDFAKPDIIAIKKKITLPPIASEKINNPSYMNYYQLVREKIKRCAYQNYSRSEEGEAYLSFIISDDGLLRETRLSEEKSSPSPYLRRIALESVKDASPFPNFPKELDYPQLSFNVIISFEIE